jgi:hypothetical protein
MAFSAYFVSLAFLTFIGSVSAAALLSARYTEWIFLGCYTDNVSARSLPYGISVPGGPFDMTVKLCQAACLNDGFQYAGVEYADECCK